MPTCVCVRACLRVCAFLQLYAYDMCMPRVQAYVRVRRVRVRRVRVRRMMCAMCGRTQTHQHTHGYMHATHVHIRARTHAPLYAGIPTRDTHARTWRKNTTADSDEFDHPAGEWHPPSNLTVAADAQLMVCPEEHNDGAQGSESDRTRIQTPPPPCTRTVTPTPTHPHTHPPTHTFYYTDSDEFDHPAGEWHPPTNLTVAADVQLVCPGEHNDGEGSESDLSESHPARSHLFYNPLELIRMAVRVANSE